MAIDIRAIVDLALKDQAFRKPDIGAAAGARSYAETDLTNLRVLGA